MKRLLLLTIVLLFAAPVEAGIKYSSSASSSSTPSDTVYGVGWDGDTTTAPSKNAVYDKIQTLSGGTPALAQKSANYTVTTSDYTLEATSNTFTFTLPTSASCTAGQFFFFINSGTGVVTVDGNGSETINGDLTVDLYQYDSVTLVPNGTGWLMWA